MPAALFPFRDRDYVRMTAFVKAGVPYIPARFERWKRGPEGLNGGLAFYFP